MAQQQKIKLSDIADDPELQPRAGMNLETIEDYASDMRRGDKFFRRSSCFTTENLLIGWPTAFIASVRHVPSDPRQYCVKYGTAAAKTARGKTARATEKKR
jgi:hypothetical protein